MEKSIACILLLLVSLNVLSQKIICAEYVTKSIYLYHRIVKKMVEPAEPSLAIFDKGYSVEIKEAKSLNIDSIYYRKKYLQSDTLKYLTWVSNNLGKIKKYFDDQRCIDLYQKCVNIDKLIKPKRFIKIRHLAKDDCTAKIGLSYVKAEWLHLKISDILASEEFDAPPTLRNPFSNSRMFDIYIPLKVIEINNDVRLNHRFIITSIQ